MKKFFLGWLMLMLGVFVAGCGGGSNADTDKKTLIYATASDATRLDPQMMTDIYSYSPMYAKVYQTLIQVDKNGDLKPLLATEWKNVDPVTWEFKLQQGVKFHDGTPFNAEAVKKTFERLIDPNNKKSQSHMLKMVKEIKVVDEYTVQIITTEPFPPLLLHLAHNASSIISPKALEEDAAGTKSLDQNPVGTGPFKLEKWTKGEGMTLVATPEYWGKKPAIEKIVYRVIPEDATRMGLVQSGEAHIADKLPFNDVERYNKDDRFTVLRTTGYGTEFIGLNMKKEKFQDLRVRKAIDLGIDRQAILSGVYYGIGELNTPTISPKVFGYNPNLPKPEYNPEKAKELLKEAGVGNLQIVLWTSSNNKARIKMAEVIQDQLRNIGITVEIKTLEWGTFLQAHHDGETEMYLMGWSNASGDAAASLGPVWTQEGIGNANGSYYVNPEVEALMAEAAKEMDPEKRKQLYWKVQEITTADEVRFVTRTTEYVSLARKNVKGAAFTPAELFLVDDVVIE